MGNGWQHFAGLLKAGSAYWTTSAGFEGPAEVSSMPESPAMQLTIEHQEGRNVIRAVLQAATVGPVRATALVSSSRWREQVCQ